MCNPWIVNVPLPPLTATEYVTLFTITVMFPVASPGSVNVITSSSPEAIGVVTATLRKESTLDTVNVVALVLDKYLSFSRYVTVMSYVPFLKSATLS